MKVEAVFVGCVSNSNWKQQLELNRWGCKGLNFVHFGESSKTARFFNAKIGAIDAERYVLLLLRLKTFTCRR